MIYRLCLTTILCLSVSTLHAGALLAQATRDARFAIIGTVLAERAAARIPMPYGNDGFELTDAGMVDQKKIDQAIKKNGQSIDVGKIVEITDISFSDNKIEIELDNGGKKDKKWYERIEVGMGSKTTPVSPDDPKKPPQGSKIVLKFAQKVPADITPDKLRDLLNPVLDFTAPNMKTGIAALPPEFQEAVKAKEARIGMDKNTVRMALGRQNHTSRDTDENGNPQETWIYQGRGARATFIWFQNDVVVKIAHYSSPQPQ